jgi:hypothetical protein
MSVRENNAVVFASTAVETYRKGYPEFAAFIDSSESFRLFRRFGWLRARRLLFLQHGLGKLERQLRQVDQSCQDYQHARAAQSLLQPDIKAIMTEASEMLHEYGRCRAARARADSDRTSPPPQVLRTDAQLPRRSVVGLS